VLQHLATVHSTSVAFRSHMVHLNIVHTYTFVCVFRRAYIYDGSQLNTHTLTQMYLFSRSQLNIPFTKGGSYRPPVENIISLFLVRVLVDVLDYWYRNPTHVYPNLHNHLPLPLHPPLGTITLTRTHTPEPPSP
jgi:hypothetical protein